MAETNNGLPVHKIEDYKRVFDELKFEVVGRDRVLDQMKLAFLTRQHVLLWGPTGEGKTYLTNSVFRRVTGLDDEGIFRLQFTRDMPPEVLFGGYDIKALQLGEVKYNVKDSALTCNFMFGDEVFDAPDFVLRQMLGILADERTLRFGRQVYEGVPLHTAVLTSNFRRDNAATNALLNRILFQYNIHGDTETKQRAMLDVLSQTRRGLGAGEKAKIAYGDIKELSNVVLGKDEGVTMVLPWEIVYMKDMVISRFVDEVRKKGGQFSTDGDFQAFQKEAIGGTLEDIEKADIGRDLGFPLNVFKGRVAPLVLSSAMRMIERSRGGDLGEDFRISPSRGMAINNLLYALALMDNRDTVLKSDLWMTRYGLYPQAESETLMDTCFRGALSGVLGGTSDVEISQAGRILGCLNLADLLFDRASKAVIPKALAESFSGYSTEVSLDRLKKIVDLTSPKSSDLFELRGSVLSRINDMIRLKGGSTVDVSSNPKVKVYPDVK